MPKSPRIVPEYCSRLWTLTRFSFIWYHILGSRVPFWGNQGLYSIIKSQYSCSWTLDTVAPLFSMKWCINSVHGVGFPAFSHTVIPVYLSEVLASSLSFSFRFPIQSPVVDFTDLSRSVCETSDLKTLKNGMEYIPFFRQFYFSFSVLNTLMKQENQWAKKVDWV